jgi:phage baseplate assembly protein W
LVNGFCLYKKEKIMAAGTNTDRSFLGKGWSFPPTFLKGAGELEMVAEEEDINQSLQILLATEVGERFLQPLFGCNLDRFVFEPMNATVSTELRLTVKRAIDLFEPRIKLVSIKLDTAFIVEGRVDIAVEYLVIITNTRHNLVYPFYMAEAINKTA